MATRARARELLDRSRVLLDRSREAAAQFLATQREVPERPRPAVIEAPRPEREPREPGVPEQALVDICASVALRDLNLVDALLSQLEEMEAKEDDEDRLAELYRLDHLATRLRRNAENLRVLAGRDAGDTASETVSLVDVVRAAMSSIDQYSRITIGRVVSLGVVGFAAEDLSRLLAELLDNAANQSPPNSPVRVSAHLTEQGSVLLRIEDEGIGLPPERLRELNDRLSNAPVLDHDAVRHMGLAVVRRLAGRHDMRASLDRRVPHGTTATVLLPSALVCELPESAWSGTQTVTIPIGRTAAEAEPEATPGTGSDTGAGLFADAGARRVPEQPERHETTAAGLPRRTPAGNGQPAPRPRPAPVPATGGTTASGLPRRVSRSLKKPSGEEGSPAAPSAPTGPEERPEDGHDRLLADLGAFSDGQQAALDEQRAATEGETDGPSEDTK
ncbi:signal transduction histidine kinase [Prauserella shujinwangii]|uniref:histidine kinase n=1 Tax=Prauserella shujinwangii TaxID=1453103 RepID=A0A2T0LQT7_9PSEU|nr:ATP-binding protein [Prauserella shujinwangii]PRX45866.1 signal transduction histidine kinase [Prauserella shujinwangii]